MGSNSITWIIIIITIINLSSSSLLLHGSSLPQPYDLPSLRALIYDRAAQALANRPRTGTVYRLSLPANFSDMSASVVRLRSGSFLASGSTDANPSFLIPPGMMPMPYVKRIALLFEDLASLSRDYFHVPGHSLVAPVAGFSAYNASSATGIGSSVQLVSMVEPIVVLFPNTVTDQRNNVTKKCVLFTHNGSIELGNMTKLNACSWYAQGHYSVAVQSAPERKGVSKWWWVGIAAAAGVGGLVVVSLVGVVVCMVVRRRKIKEMEKQSENDVAFDTFWIGGSKMPSAPMVRTQPILENEYIP